MLPQLQGALIELMAADPSVRPLIKLVQHRMMNSQPEVDFALQDFVIHFPGPLWEAKLPMLEMYAAYVLPQGRWRQPYANVPPMLSPNG